MTKQPNQKNRMLFLLALFFFYLCPSLQVSAANHQLPEGIVIGDDQGIQVKADGEYLMELRNILPGETYDVTISLMNIDEKGAPYELFFWIDPAIQIEGPIHFDQALSMTIDYDGTLLYEGIVAGTGTSNLQREEHSLGIFLVGESRAMKVHMKMDSSYTNEDFIQKSVTENIWHFRAIRQEEPTQPPTTEPPTSSGGKVPGKPGLTFPQTGEEWRDALLYLSIGILLIAGVILFWIRKRQQESKGGIKK